MSPVSRCSGCSNYYLASLLLNLETPRLKFNSSTVFIYRNYGFSIRKQKSPLMISSHLE